MKLYNYLQRRANERTTWVGLTTAIVAGLGYPHPYNYILISFGVIGVLVPSSTSDK